MPRPSLPLVFEWCTDRPPPRLALRLAERRLIRLLNPPPEHCVRPFDFGRAMSALCEDIIRRTPLLAHVDLSRLLFSIALARNGRRHGLQARVTPLRFVGGALATVF